MNPVAIVMNFALLGSLVYCIYYQQIVIHFAAASVHSALPLRLWLACMALNFAMLAGMYAIGIWERRHDLDDRSMRWGVSLTYETTLSSVGLAVIGAMIPDHQTGAVVTILIVVLAASLRGQVASRVTGLLLPAR